MLLLVWFAFLIGFWVGVGVVDQDNEIAAHLVSILTALTMLILMAYGAWVLVVG